MKGLRLRFPRLRRPIVRVEPCRMNGVNYWLVLLFGGKVNFGRLVPAQRKLSLRLDRHADRRLHYIAVHVWPFQFVYCLRPAS